MAPAQDKEFGLSSHWKALLMLNLVSLGSFIYGFDFGILGGLQAMVGFLKVFGQRAPSTAIGWNISVERQQLITSLLALGKAASALTAGFTAKYFGRKASLWVGCVLVFVSVALMQTTTNIGGIYAGRLIIGLANGILNTHGQLYVLECAPSRYRGLGISMFTFWTTVGGFLGSVIDNFTAKIDGRNAYIIPLGIVHVAPLIITVGLFFIPESPRWLATRYAPVSHLYDPRPPQRFPVKNDYMERDKNPLTFTTEGRTPEAERALRRLRPTEWPISQEMDEINMALDAQARLQSSVGYRALFRDPVDRRRTTLSVLILLSHGATGFTFVISYGTYFFEMANVGNAFANTSIITGVGVAALLFNMVMINKFGRRAMLLTGAVLCGLSQLGNAIAYTIEPGTQKTGKAIIGFTISFVASYNGLVAPCTWLLGAEVASQRLRSHTFGLASATIFIVTWLVQFTAPYFINPLALGWGPKYCYIWAGGCAIAAIWIWLCVPEVQGRTLEEVDEMFEARVHVRKFRSYQCKRRPVNFDSSKDGSEVKDAEA